MQIVLEAVNATPLEDVAMFCGIPHVKLVYLLPLISGDLRFSLDSAQCQVPSDGKCNPECPEPWQTDPESLSGPPGHSAGAPSRAGACGACRASGAAGGVLRPFASAADVSYERPDV